MRIRIFLDGAPVLDMPAHLLLAQYSLDGRITACPKPGAVLTLEVDSPLESSQVFRFIEKVPADPYEVEE